MQCPVCSTKLVRTKYEGRPVFNCSGCNGYLVQTQQVTSIQRRREKAPEELTEEARERALDENVSLIRCPRCRQHMRKEKSHGRHHFEIDKCRSCDMIWFDVGELACFQQNYESSEKGKEAARFQDRHRNMTDDDREAFEEDLANLPPGDTSLLSAFGAGLIEAFAEHFWDD